MSGAGAIFIADPAGVNFVGLDNLPEVEAARTAKETLLRWRERNTRRPVPCVSTLPGHSYRVDAPVGGEEAVARAVVDVRAARGARP